MQYELNFDYPIPEEFFIARFEKLNKQDFDSSLYTKFARELAYSPYTEYYFSLMTDRNTNHWLRHTLDWFFDCNKNAREFLLEKLGDDKYKDLHDGIRSFLKSPCMVYRKS